mgnify:CR=1 FL=1
MKKIVVICGGSGALTELRGLSELPDVEITAMPNTFDSGGAQAVFLEHYPESVAMADVDKCLVALAQDPLQARLHRFRFGKAPGDGLSDHRQTVGNIIWIALQNMEEPRVPLRTAIAHLAKKLDLKPWHRVEPIAIQRADLCVRLENGTEIRGETHVDVPKHDGRLRIVDAWLEPPAEMNEYALEAIRNAELIVIGPGDLYSSLVPCFLPQGVSEALGSTKAKIAYVVNLMTKYGETTDFKASDFLAVVTRYASRTMDFVICNSVEPSRKVGELYEEERAIPVENDLSGEGVIKADLLDTTSGTARHHSRRLASLLVSLIG